MPRIDWSGRVCIGLRQEGLAKSYVGVLPCLSDAHDGKEGLDRRHGHRFCRGSTGRYVEFLSDF